MEGSTNAIVKSLNTLTLIKFSNSNCWLGLSDKYLAPHVVLKLKCL